MALDILAKNQLIGISEETISGNWGTPKTATTQFKRQYYDVGVTLPDFGKSEGMIDTVGANGEMEEQGRYVSDSVSGLKRLPFSGFATRKNISDHLMAAFQDLYGGEGAATPYPKIFNCGDSQVDFPSGEGVTYSVGVDYNHGDSPEAINSGLILENAIIDSLTLEINMLGQAQDKYMKMNGVWVGRDLEDEVNFSSTWLNEDGTAYSSSYSPTFYNIGSANWFNLVSSGITIGGNNVGGCLRRFSMTLNNNITSDCVTTGGKPNNYKRNRELTYELDLPCNSATMKAVAGYKDGSDVVMNAFTNGTAYTALGGFQFVLGVGKLVGEPQEINGDYMAIRLNVKALRPNAGYVGVVGLSDGIDKGW